MDKGSANKLCEIFGFGSLKHSPKAVTGGLLHNMWYIETDTGEFAVKELNPHIMTRKNIKDEYNRSERIAHAFKDKGIPAVASILFQNNSVIEIESSYFIIYPWVEGQTIDIGAISTSHANKMGGLLAKLHQTNLSFPDLPIPDGGFHSNDHLISLSNKSLLAKLPFAKHLHEKLDDIFLWNKMYQDAFLKLNKHLLVGHGDLDQKNVLWKNDGSPALIDWEGSGLINPTRDIITTALAWSGVDSLNVDIDVLRSMLNEYQKAGGKLGNEIQDAFHAQMGGINWMVYNIQRSLGEGTASEYEIKLGISQTEQTLKVLEYLENNIDLWARKCTN